MHKHLCTFFAIFCLALMVDAFASGGEQTKTSFIEDVPPVQIQQEIVDDEPVGAIAGDFEIIPEEDEVVTLLPDGSIRVEKVKDVKDDPTVRVAYYAMLAAVIPALVPLFLFLLKRYRKKKRDVDSIEE